MVYCWAGLRVEQKAEMKAGCLAVEMVSQKAARLVDCWAGTRVEHSVVYLADSKAAWLAYAMVALSVFQKAASMVDMMG
jgi:uncharacterized RDD family membrane protein YckC